MRAETMKTEFRFALSVFVFHLSGSRETRDSKPETRTASAMSGVPVWNRRWIFTARNYRPNEITPKPIAISIDRYSEAKSAVDL
jgi:hypothetical protein